MSGRRECEVVHDLLDALPSGGAGPGVGEQVRLHAAECAECATLLRMHDLLELPAPGELEAAVPDLHARGMWAAVRDARPGAANRPRRRGSGWLVPALAAASLVLAVVAGGLAIERGRLLERQSELAGRLASQERLLAGQERRLAVRERSGSPEGLGGIALVGMPAWERTLSGRETVSLGRVRELLESIPPGATLLDRAELEALASATPSGPLRAGAPWPDLGNRIDMSDGLQAGELLSALRALDIGDRTRIPTARVIELYRAAQRSARS